MKKIQSRLITCSLAVMTIAIIAVSAAGCGSSAAATTTTVATTPYTNALYKLDVLAQWKIDNSNPKDITVNSADPNTYVRVITANSPVTSLDSYLTECEKIFKLAFPTYARQSSTKITLNGLQAYSLNVTFTKSGVPLQGRMIVVVKGTQGYCAVGMTTPALWSTNSKDLDIVLNSLVAK